MVWTMQDANNHFDPMLAAKKLGNSLAHRCNPNSILVMPKSLALDLYSCNLVEEYIRPFNYMLLEFIENIDRKSEKSPDAKALADFVGFAYSLGGQARFNLGPIRQFTGSMGVAEVCNSVTEALSTFHKDVRKVAFEAADQLVRNVFPELTHHDSESALNLLQWMSIENRKRQEGIARVYLDQIQTV